MFILAVVILRIVFLFILAIFLKQQFGDSFNRTCEIFLEWQHLNVVFDNNLKPTVLSYFVQG